MVLSIRVSLSNDCNPDDESTKANHAFVFLLVALNDNFKVPVAYFLIRHLNAAEGANLITSTLHFLHEYEIVVHSMTYDGASVNSAMANKLGARMDVSAPNCQFHMYHPVTNDKIFIFPDPCHMLKNIRNALGQTYQQSKDL